MHLLLVTSSLKFGGSEKILSELANYWISVGHEVNLITLVAPDVKPWYYLDPKINLIQLNQLNLTSNQQNKELFLRRIVKIIKRIYCIRKILVSLKPDIVISFIDVMNITALLAAIGLKIPVIVSERTNPVFYKLPYLYKKIRKIIYHQAFCVVVQTNSVAKYFKYLNKLIIIPNPVNEPHTKKSIIHNLNPVKVIVSVGRLCKFKGFDTLIKAFANIQPKYNDLKLIIYGEGTERENLQKLISSLNLEENVFLPGVIHNIQQAILNTDLFVFPSHYEGFPNALCEAMAIGLPIVASNCSGNIDIVIDNVNGRLFPIGDVDQLTIIIQELLNDPEKRSLLGEQAKTICSKYNSNYVYKLWDQILVKLK